MKKSQREKSGEDVHAKILLAASKEFSAKGYEGARVDEIAKVARVNKATIYYRVGDKKELYKTVLISVLGGMADKLDENIAEIESPDEKLKAYVGTIVSNVTNSKYFTPIIMRELAGGGKNIPPEIFSVLNRIINTIESILKNGKKEKIFRGVDHKTIHFMVVGTLNFMLSAKIAFGRGEKTGSKMAPSAQDMGGEKLAAMISDILLYGIKER